MSNKTRFSPKFTLFLLTATAACGVTVPTLPEVQARAESIRGLKFVRPVVEEKMTDAEFRKMTSKIDDEQNRLTGHALSLFGFLDPGYDFAAEIRKLVSGGAGAAYNWERRSFVVPDSVPKAQLAEAYHHEIIHALQDQVFDLAPRFQRLKDAGQTDQKLALRFLTEADAVLCQYWEYHEAGTLELDKRAAVWKEAQKKSGIPMILMGPVQIMPYAEAPHVLGPIVRKHGWKAVDRIYIHPTPSTEWFLHPEKLVNLKDVPVEIPQTAFPRLPNRNWKRVSTDVLGEYQLLLLLQKHLDDETARKAAAGWGGDRYNLYAHGDRHVLVWKIEMDTAGDLRELTGALRTLNEKVTALMGKGHTRRLIEKRRSIFLVAGERADVAAFAGGLQ